MQNGKVSIIIPFKNTAHFLPECLDSIVNQTYIDWEVLAVNDHSTDTSLELLSSYSQRDKRIKVFSLPKTLLHELGGLSGIDIPFGEFWITET